jgi:hypothetical protein
MADRSVQIVDVHLACDVIVIAIVIRAMREAAFHVVVGHPHGAAVRIFLPGQGIPVALGILRDGSSSFA